MTTQPMTLDALIEKAAREIEPFAWGRLGLADTGECARLRERSLARARAALLAVLPDIGEHLAGVVERHVGFDSYADALRAEVRRITGETHD